MGSAAELVGAERVGIRCHFLSAADTSRGQQYRAAIRAQPAPVGRGETGLARPAHGSGRPFRLPIPALAARGRMVRGSIARTIGCKRVSVGRSEKDRPVTVSGGLRSMVNSFLPVE
jgi:hypothetical protein